MRNFEGIASNLGIHLEDIQKKLEASRPRHVPKGVTIPTSFDARNQWTTCVHSVRDQMDCGCCWAFASAGFLEDRFCIQSNGAIDVRLAPQDMINCDYSNGGCNGGYLTPSIGYLMAEGLVSDACLPYENGAGFCSYKCSDNT